MRKKYFILTGITVFIATALLLKFRRTIPKGIKAIQDFNKEKYLGKWYEIARFDYRFEKDLNNTSAEYSLNPDGSIKVLNKGYNYKTKKFKKAIGKAVFADAETEGKLKVSFFGPIYGGYNIIAIDEDYKNALVAGQSLKYLWLLSRDREMPKDKK